jgi:hypothetical protein
MCPRWDSNCIAALANNWDPAETCGTPAGSDPVRTDPRPKMCTMCTPPNSPFCARKKQPRSPLRERGSPLRCVYGRVRPSNGVVPTPAGDGACTRRNATALSKQVRRVPNSVRNPFVSSPQRRKCRWPCHYRLPFEDLLRPSGRPSYVYLKRSTVAPPLLRRCVAASRQLPSTPNPASPSQPPGNGEPSCSRRLSA